MKVDIFTLCDSANEYNGKLVIVGAFNSIFSQKFPAIHPDLALVARIVFDEKESGVHKIELAIKKRDEEVFILPIQQIESDTTKSKGTDAVVNLVVKGNNIMIPSAGIYTILLKVDDQSWESDLKVVQTTDQK